MTCFTSSKKELLDGGLPEPNIGTVVSFPCFADGSGEGEPDDVAGVVGAGGDEGDPDAGAIGCTAVVVPVLDALGLAPMGGLALGAAVSLALGAPLSLGFDVGALDLGAVLGIGDGLTVGDVLGLGNDDVAGSASQVNQASAVFPCAALSSARVKVNSYDTEPLPAPSDAEANALLDDPYVEANVASVPLKIVAPTNPLQSPYTPPDPAAIVTCR